MGEGAIDMGCILWAKTSVGCCKLQSIASNIVNNLSVTNWKGAFEKSNRRTRTTRRRWFQQPCETTIVTMVSHGKKLSFSTKLCIIMLFYFFADDPQTEAIFLTFRM